MKIRSVEFVGAVAAPGGAAPEGLPEVAFSGRSNVGKSSLINRLLGRTRTPVARVSGTPGKTREINFFHVDAIPEPPDPQTREAHDAAPAVGDTLEFHLVDLPGYGYANVPKGVRDAWKPLIEDYLGRSPDLHGVVQLVDARHDPTADDLRMIEYLAALGVPALIVLTKVDKLKRSERERRFTATARKLELDMEQIVSFSAVTGEGREPLLAALQSLLTRPRS